MGHSRPSQRDLAAAKKTERQAEMDRAIAEGRLTVRRMTAEEREQSATRRAAAKGPPDVGDVRLPVTRFRSGRRGRAGGDRSPVRRAVSRHRRRCAARCLQLHRGVGAAKLARQSPIGSMVNSRLALRPRISAEACSTPTTRPTRRGNPH